MEDEQEKTQALVEDDAGGDEDQEPSEEFAGEPSGQTEVGARSPWEEKLEAARKLWEVGNNAELRRALQEISTAPNEEVMVHGFVKEMKSRLKPDPIAIALFFVTILVFSYLTYRYILH